MRIEQTTIPGAYTVELERIEDQRGFFSRAWCKNEFGDAGLVTEFVQANISYNRVAGTLRGFHYQCHPHEEVKLVRCVRGAIVDVIVDLRRESPHYLEAISVELTADNRRMLYVPAGFAHAFQTLEDDTEVFYQVSAFYAPGSERGLRYNDPRLGISWPLEVTEISAKDSNWPDVESIADDSR